MKKLVSILCLIAMLVSLCACGSTQTTSQTSTPSTSETGVKDPIEVEDKTEVETVTSLSINMAKDYSDIEKVLSDMYAKREKSEGYFGGRGGDDMMVEEAATADGFATNGVSDDSVKSVEAPTSVESEADYSGTNVQVAGIDEGDVVKTDGKYIYILRGYYLIITDVNGKDTKVLSQTQIGSDKYENANDIHTSESKNLNEMYIYNDTLAVLGNIYKNVSGKKDGNWFYENENYVTIDLYDVTDRENPKFITSLGQDGSLEGSRLKDGKLYVVSNKYNYNYYEEYDEIAINIPQLYDDGVATKVAATDICIAPIVLSENYATVCEYDLENYVRNSVVSILGGGDEIYMSHNNIYILNSEYYDNESEPRTESVYTVVDHLYETVTSIYRLSIAEGLKLESVGKVDGYMESQFSADEFNDTLRIVTTYDNYSYTTYTDEAMGFVNYKYSEDNTESQNNLYVLDRDLNIIGSIEGLAEGEYIYSARFDGDIGYFCTYRQVDPLFTVDLTDPQNPIIKSELKITGFSEYLHPWTSTLLFGAGYEADEDTGWRENIKLVMFDTSDKTAVFAANTLNTDIWGSEAMYNHKAFLIDYNKNLIAFPGYEDYYIYSYDEDGFHLQSEISLDGWPWDTRGLYVDDMIYIVGTEEIHLIDMTTMKNVGVINIMNGLDMYSVG